MMLLALLVCTCGMQAQFYSAPAFPGAEGFGRYTTGGRGGKVIHVTNLNDSGTGSLRAAIKTDGARIIVFDVAGTIELQSDLKIEKNNCTILGQTAPGGGICLRNYTLHINANNVIVRFIRCRMGDTAGNENDAMSASHKTGSYKKNIIIDHCSVSWCVDECGSFYGNENFTMQWCILSESLTNSVHDKGSHGYGGIWGGDNAAFHHNLLAHHNSRNPRFDHGYLAEHAGIVDYINNVVYNWGGNSTYGGENKKGLQPKKFNMINNYYKAGPGTKNKTRVTQVSVSDATNGGDNPFPGYASRYYIKGNYVTAASTKENYDWSGVIYDDGLTTQNGEKYIKDTEHRYGNVEYVNIGGTDCVKLKLNTPIDAGEITTHSAQTTYNKILQYCGASLSRDGVDTRNIEEARTGTTTYNGDVAYTNSSGETFATSKTKGILDFINDPTSDKTEPKTASYPELTSESRPSGFDTDGDGIPDEWETLNGLNPNDASDAQKKTIDARGWYSNLEVYLNSLVEHIMKGGNADAESAVDEYYPAFKATGINDVLTSSEIAKIEYYSLDGSKTSEPSRGISIRKMTYTNGKTVTDKVIRK